MRTAWQRPAELRINVEPEAMGPIAQELDTLHGRLYTPGDRLHGLPSLPLPQPGFRMRRREADGEWYVYVEDLHHHRLAGYTVFNRLVEMDRHADAHVRAPHFRFGAPYQRRGLATAVYRWGLDSGLCLVSGAYALWQALARHHETGYVDLREKRLRHLGREVAPALDARGLLRGRAHDWRATTTGGLTPAGPGPADATARLHSGGIRSLLHNLLRRAAAGLG